MPAGRPSSYKPKYCEQARALILLGATDEKLADILGVNIDTIYEWKKKHPEFSDALNVSKEEMDAAVEKSLFHRAMGYKHKAVKIMQHEGEIITQEFEEVYPPDATAMIFWLKNRQPQKWRDKQELEISPSESLVELLAEARKRREPK